MKNTIISFVKRELKIRNMTQKQLAYMSNMSEKKISRILSNENSNIDELKILLESLSYDYEQLLLFYKTKQRIFNHFYEALCNFNEELCVKLISQARDIHEYLSSPKDDPFSTELSMMGQTHLFTYYPDQFDIKTYLSLEANILELSDFHKAAYYDFLGAYFKNIYDFKQAYLYFQRALSFNPAQLVSSMVYYHLGTFYASMGYYDFSLIASSRAIFIFRNTHNIRRAITCELHIANIYARNNRFLSAKNLYLNIIQEAKDNHDNDLISRCYSNLAYLANKEKNYQETLEYLIKYEKYIDQVDETRILIKLQALLGLEERKEFIDLFETTKSQFKENTISHSELMILKYQFDNHDKDQYLNHLLKHFEEYKYSDDYERILDIYNLVIESYTEKGNYYSANKYMKDKMAYIENPSNIDFPVIII